jgi:hypothetical protein
MVIEAVQLGPLSMLPGLHGGWDSPARPKRCKDQMPNKKSLADATSPRVRAAFMV